MIDKSEIEIMIDKQRKWCFKDFLQIDAYQTDRAKFYRNVLGAVFSVIGISIVVFGGLVAWSYAPIQDIAALKAEVRILNDKSVSYYVRMDKRQGRKKWIIVIPVLSVIMSDP